MFKGGRLTKVPLKRYDTPADVYGVQTWCINCCVTGICTESEAKVH
jgi:hypothetical protein